MDENVHTAVLRLRMELADLRSNLKRIDLKKLWGGVWIGRHLLTGGLAEGDDRNRAATYKRFSQIPYYSHVHVLLAHRMFPLQEWIYPSPRLLECMEYVSDEMCRSGKSVCGRTQPVD